LIILIRHNFIKGSQNISFYARMDLQSVLDVLKLEGIELRGLIIKTKMKLQNERNWLQTSSRDNIIFLLTKHL